MVWQENKSSQEQAGIQDPNKTGKKSKHNEAKQKQGVRT